MQRFDSCIAIAGKSLESRLYFSDDSTICVEKGSRGDLYLFKKTLKFSTLLSFEDIWSSNKLSVVGNAAKATDWLLLSKKELPVFL